MIDGVPVISDASTFSTGTLKNPALNPLTNINPNDIESIEILKDASATSIYGAVGRMVLYWSLPNKVKVESLKSLSELNTHCSR